VTDFKAQYEAEDVLKSLKCMNNKYLSLCVLEDRLAVVKLPPSPSIPEWAVRGEFFQVSRTPGEMTLVCPEVAVPKSVACQNGWRALRIEGGTELHVPGILSAALSPLAAAGVGIFAFSTYETDIVLVQQADLDKAKVTLEAAGHSVASDDDND